MNQMRTRHSLRFVYVYYEGEGSERAYLRFLRSRFHDVVVIRGKKGFYPTAKQDLKKPDSDLNIKWNDIDEIWFFFDIDPDAMMDGKLNSWNNLESLIRKIRRKSKKINIRLLMTTGCIEYWRGGKKGRNHFGRGYSQGFALPGISKNAGANASG